MVLPWDLPQSLYQRMQVPVISLKLLPPWAMAVHLSQERQRQKAVLGRTLGVSPFSKRQSCWIHPGQLGQLYRPPRCWSTADKRR